MNKYEKNGEFPQLSKEEKSEFDKVFNLFREIVLNNKDYALGRAREILDCFKHTHFAP